MSVLVAAQGLSKWYGPVIAVNNLTVTLEPGVTGLLGPNGAGKTSFLRLILGLIAPDNGSIEVFGRRPRSAPEIFRRIGHVSDLDAFPERMTAREFVTVMARLAGQDAVTARRRATELLERLDLARAMDRRLTTFSKGMRQRAKMAQALVHDPEFLVLDEPLTGLDPAGRRMIVAEVAAAGAAGRSVIVSSHILHEVEAMTDRILLMARGRLRALGNIQTIRGELEDRPFHVEVRCTSPRRLAAHLLGRPCVRSAGIAEEEGERGLVTVETDRAEAFFTELPGHILDLGITLESVHCPDDNLESLFRLLVA